MAGRADLKASLVYHAVTVGVLLATQATRRPTKDARKPTRYVGDRDLLGRGGGTSKAGRGLAARPAYGGVRGDARSGVGAELPARHPEPRRPPESRPPRRW